jgi:hypothetical protein
MTQLLAAQRDRFPESTDSGIGQRRSGAQSSGLPTALEVTIRRNCSFKLRSPFRHRSDYRLSPVICRFVPLNGGVYPPLGPEPH